MTVESLSFKKEEEGEQKQTDKKGKQSRSKHQSHLLSQHGGTVLKGFGKMII